MSRIIMWIFYIYAIKLAIVIAEISVWSFDNADHKIWRDEQPVSWGSTDICNIWNISNVHNLSDKDAERTIYDKGCIWPTKLAIMLNLLQN